MDASGWTVEDAVADDAVAIVRLRDLAALRQVQRGIRQWQVGEVTVAQVRGEIAVGRWWVVRDGAGAVRAAVRVLAEDPQVWGAVTGSALYVHGLVVDGDLAGQGLGAWLLSRVEDRARREGRGAVRLDCVASNDRLRRYYTDQGYRLVGEKSWGAEPTVKVALLEKTVGADEP